MEEYLKKAVAEARLGMNKQDGGPFGAVIVKEGEIIGVGHNQVLVSNDPTAHAEIMAIRNACKNLKTYDLSGSIIYSTSEPCPMCLAAIIWANIKEVYFGTNRIDVGKIGFRDDKIYEYFENHKKDLLDVKEIKNLECEDLLSNYKDEIY